jgi:hypothetical protein
LLWLLALAGCMPAVASPSAAENEVSITVRDGVREIRSNGIPLYTPGQFPNRGNPNAIASQRHVFRMPAAPALADRLTEVGLWPVGVALDGVPFDPGAAEFWNGDRRWQYEALSGAIDLGLDRHHAHVQPTGAYHYHGLPTGLIESRDAQDGPLLIGWAADGFPIYADRGYTDPQDPHSDVVRLHSSYRLKIGPRPEDGPPGAYDGTFVQDWEYLEGYGDLDACNGRFGVTPEYPNGTYHYVVMDVFPFVPRRLRGTPDESFVRRHSGGGRPPRRGHHPPPHPWERGRSR